MQISDVIFPTSILVRPQIASKARLIEELAQRASAAVGVDAGQIVALLLKREELGSTGIGSGIALPHARHEGLESPFGALACLERSIDYDAIDDKPVDLIFLLLLPITEDKVHLSALAKTARLLRDTRVQAQLRGAKSVAAIHAVLCASTIGYSQPYPARPSAK